MFILQRINKFIPVEEIGKVNTKNRSKWKGIYTKIFRRRTRKKGIRFYPYIFNRASTVLPMHIDTRFYIHRGGKLYSIRTITKEMVGYKFGEFTITAHIGSDIHKTLKNKNKYKQKKK